MRAEGLQARTLNAEIESEPSGGGRSTPLVVAPALREKAWENRSAGLKFAVTAGQKAMWLPQILFQGKPVANTGAAVAIEGALDPPLFAEAIRRLVEETDALRMSFGMEGDVPYQEVRD